MSSSQYSPNSTASPPSNSNSDSNSNLTISRDTQKMYESWRKRASVQEQDAVDFFSEILNRFGEDSVFNLNDDDVDNFDTNYNDGGESYVNKQDPVPKNENIDLIPVLQVSSLSPLVEETHCVGQHISKTSHHNDNKISSHNSIGDHSCSSVRNSKNNSLKECQQCPTRHSLNTEKLNSSLRKLETWRKRASIQEQHVIDYFSGILDMFANDDALSFSDDVFSTIDGGGSTQQENKDDGECAKKNGDMEEDLSVNAEKNANKNEDETSVEAITESVDTKTSLFTISEHFNVSGDSSRRQSEEEEYENKTTILFNENDIENKKVINNTSAVSETQIGAESKVRSGNCSSNSNKYDSLPSNITNPLSSLTSLNLNHSEERPISEGASNIEFTNSNSSATNTVASRVLPPSTENTDIKTPVPSCQTDETLESVQDKNKLSLSSNTIKTFDSWRKKASAQEQCAIDFFSEILDAFVKDEPPSLDSTAETSSLPSNKSSSPSNPSSSCTNLSSLGSNPILSSSSLAQNPCSSPSIQTTNPATPSSVREKKKMKKKFSSKPEYKIELYKTTDGGLGTIREHPSNSQSRETILNKTTAVEKIGSDSNNNNNNLNRMMMTQDNIQDGGVSSAIEKTLTTKKKKHELVYSTVRAPKTRQKTNLHQMSGLSRSSLFP